MALMTRLTRLFRADLHAVLDRLEEPDVLLKDAIREMEAVVAASQGELAQTERQRSALHRRIDGLERRLSELDEQLDLCLAADNESLARSRVRQKLQSTRELAQARDRLSVVEHERDERQARLAEQLATLEATRQKAEAFCTPEEPKTGTTIMDADCITDADVDVALLREKQRRVQS